MGAYGERVSDHKKLGEAIRRCLASGKCSVIHVDVNPVKHMSSTSLMYSKDARRAKRQINFYNIKRPSLIIINEVFFIIFTKVKFR